MKIIDYEGAKYVTASDAARMAGVTRQRISKLIEEGAMNIVRVGKTVLVDLNDAQEYADSDRKPGRPAK